MHQNRNTTSLTQRAYLNTLSSFLDYGARALVSLFVTPILVTGLGSAVFGIWQILNRLVGYITTVDGRPTQALKWLVANKQESDNIQGNKRAVGSALGVWLFLLPVLVVAGAILTWASPAIVRAPDHLSRLVRITFFILSINIILGVAANIPESVLRGMNLGYKRMGVVAGLNILGGLLTACAVYLGWGIVGVAWVQLLITIITGFLFWHLVKSYVPWFGVVRVSVREIYSFFKFTIWYSAWNLTSMLLMASDVIILGIVMTAGAVTEYVLTGYVSTAVRGIVTFVIGSAAPGLGGLIGRKMYAKAGEIRNEMQCIIALIATVFGSAILLWNQSFVSLWVGREHYAGSMVNFLFVLIMIQLLFIVHEGYIIDLSLDVRPKVMAGLVSSLLSIGLSLILANFFGIAGLCIAILASRSVLWIWFILINNAFLDSSLGDFLRTMWRPLTGMIVILSVSAYFEKMISATDWIRLFIYGGLSTPLLFVLYFITGFSRIQRRQMITRITSLSMNLGRLADRKIKGETG